MNRSLIMKIFLLLIFTFYNAFSQFSWKKTDTPYGGTVYTLLTNGDTLLAAEGNRIFYSLNSGLDWNKTNAWTKKSFKGFATVNKIYFAVSDDGVYRSTDLKNWSMFYTGSYSSVASDKDGNVYILKYGLLLKSTNQGYNWALTDTCHFDNPDKLYITKKYLIITGMGEIFRKEINSNKQWELIQFPGMFNNIFLSGDSTGKIFGVSNESRRFIYSFDYGETWSIKDLTSQFPTMNPKGIFCFNNTVIINSSIWGDTSRIPVYISEDNGVSWKKVTHGLPERTEVNCFNKSGNYLYAGLNGYAVIRNSLTLNNEWIILDKGINELYITGITFPDNNTYLVSTYGRGILKTTDAGITWIEATGIKGSYMGKFLQSKDGDIYIGTELDVYRSTDQGSSWVNLSSPGSNNFRRKLYETDKGIFCLAGGSIYKTTNKGNTWSTVFSSTNYNFSCFTISYNGKGFAGNNKYVYRSFDYGLSWHIVYNDFNIDYFTDAMIDSQGYVYICGVNDMVRSTDGGTVWKSVTSGMTNKHLSRMFTNAKAELFCYVQYQNNIPAELYHSTHYEVKWAKITGTLSDLIVSEVAFLGDKIFVGTDQGLYINDNTTSISEGANEVKDYFLSQNYPNPFNPATRINYSIPEAGEVNLSVYDVLGKEIKVLASEYKDAGKYEIDFNASGLSSGIYFYKIKAGAFTQTRKMILLR